ncbi:MAG: GNAT family N-acetyltransferase [Helicobacteraceae bacterium]|jgi:putative acetyltransferase|nr:GNAT family N-acetyltransferase [Helicobacteraceae bacterium]
MERASKEEYDNLIEIWELSVRASHDFLTEEDIRFYKQKIRDRYFDKIDLYAARDDDGEMTGFMGVSNDKIEMLFIRPEEMRKGIGRLFVEYAINKLHIKKADVNEQNKQAALFYKKLGFVIVGYSPLDDNGKPYPILRMALKNHNLYSQTRANEKRAD